MRRILPLLILLALAAGVSAECYQPLKDHCAELGSFNQCVKDEAIEADNIEYCECSNNDASLNACYSSFATVHKDSSYCDLMVKTDTQGWEARDKCFLDRMDRIDDIEWCDETLKSEDQRQECYEEYLDDHEGDLAVCDRFDEEQRVSCYRDAADNLNDRGVCDRIFPEGYEDCQFQSSSLCDDEVDYELEHFECVRDIREEMIENRCDDYATEFEMTLEEGKLQKHLFPGDHKYREVFYTTFSDADYMEGVTDLDLRISDSQPRSYRIDTVRLGQIVTREHVNIQLLGIDRENIGTELNPVWKENLDLCVFKTGTEIGQEPEEEALGNETEDTIENETTLQAPPGNETEENVSLNGSQEPERGVISTAWENTKAWFRYLFGLGEYNE